MSKAQQIDMLIVGFGTAYAAGHVHFYDSGTSNNKDVYADKAKGSTLANPYTLSATGRAAVPIYGDGWYKITVTDADGANTITYDDLYYGVLESTDSRSGSLTAKSDNYTIVSTDDTVTVDATTGNKTITLPDASGLSDNKVYTIKKVDATANTVTVDGNGSQTIDGATTKVLTLQYESITVQKASASTWVELRSMSAALVSRSSTTPTANYIPLADGSGVIDAGWVTTALPVGSIVAYGHNTEPSGWLKCDGTAVNRTTYANLFSAIGTHWGVGDGSTTFNLPDLRGRCVIGYGQGSGLTDRTFAATGGTETHQLTATEMPSHTHSIAVTGSGSGIGAGSDVGNNNVTGSAGSDGAHNNMQPWAAINYIIKT